VLQRGNQRNLGAEFGREARAAAQTHEACFAVDPDDLQSEALEPGGEISQNFACAAVAEEHEALGDVDGAPAAMLGESAGELEGSTYGGSTTGAQTIERAAQAADRGFRGGLDLGVFSAEAHEGGVGSLATRGALELLCMRLGSAERAAPEHRS